MGYDIYQIYFYLREDVEVFIPRFKRILCRKGLYVYTGSGGKNVLSRISRHLRKNKKMHWHIDYLLPFGKVVLIKIIRNLLERNECLINLETLKNLMDTFQFLALVRAIAELVLHI
jgi:Uri superfamily endonuclease